MQFSMRQRRFKGKSLDRSWSSVRTSRSLKRFAFSGSVAYRFSDYPGRLNDRSFVSTFSEKGCRG